MCTLLPYLKQKYALNMYSHQLKVSKTVFKYVDDFINSQNNYKWDSILLR